MIEITKDTIIGDILDVAPQTAPIFLSIAAAIGIYAFARR